MNPKLTKIVLFSEVNSKFGFPFLQELVKDPSVSVEALVTSPQGKLCSYYIEEPNPVDLEVEARKYHIPVLRPKKVNDSDVLEKLKSYHPDYFLIANYQQILKEDILAIPKGDTINFHPSPLPRYAGLAPFFWMAKNGETNGGVSCIKVVPEIDAGPIFAQRPILMKGTETALDIREIHFRQSIRLLRQMLEKIKNRDMVPKSQDLSMRTYYGKGKEEDYLIHWDQNIETILRTIRAGFPHPGAFIYDKRNQKIRILEAESIYYHQPIEHPGVFCKLGDKVLVSAKDGWLHLKTIIGTDPLLTNMEMDRNQDQRQEISIL